LNSEHGQPRIVALSGGVGGAKLVRGLTRQFPADELVVVCNTGDDFEHLGLTICPDIDSVIYAVAGLADEARGWGRAEESWNFLDSLRAMDGESWFRLGDRDLAQHVQRSAWLRDGLPLGEVTARLCRAHGVRHLITPMSDAPVRTMLRTADGWLDFQDYFVRQRAAPVVEELRYQGAESAAACLAWASLEQTLEAIIICPSNPYLSIDPILAIAAWRHRLRERRVPVVAVSPIVGGDALKGCAAKLLREFGLPVTPVSIARHYGGLLDGIVIDDQDAAFAPEIERLGIVVRVAPTVMRDDRDRDGLAQLVVQFAGQLPRRAGNDRRKQA